MIFLLPALNEEEGLPEVLPKIKSAFPRAKIFVVDGGSKDRTVQIAEKFRCRVMRQKGKGKGNAIIEALEAIDDNETVAMMDADGSYEVNDIKGMLAVFDENAIMIGNRLALMDSGSLSRLNLFGDKALNLIASVLFFKRINDMLSGIRVFKCKKIKELNLKAQNFEIETEMTLRALKKGIKLVEIPCHYYRRKGKSKLHPFKDGFRIFKRICIERLN